MSNKKILILPGDGIGNEVMAEVVKIINWMEKTKSLSFDYLVGGYDGSFDVKQSARERIASGLEHKFPMAGNISSYANIPQEELWEVVQNPDHVIQFQPMKYHLLLIPARAGIGELHGPDR